MFDPTQPLGPRAAAPSAAASAEDTAALTRSLCALAYAQFALVQHAGLDHLPSVTDHLAGSVEAPEAAEVGDTAGGIDSPPREPGGAQPVLDHQTPPEPARPAVDEVAALRRSGAALPELVPASAGISSGYDLDLDPEPARAPTPVPVSGDLEGARRDYLGTLPPDDVLAPTGNNTMQLLEEIAFLED